MNGEENEPVYFIIRPRQGMDPTPRLPCISKKRLGEDFGLTRFSQWYAVEESYQTEPASEQGAYRKQRGREHCSGSAGRRQDRLHLAQPGTEYQISDISSEGRNAEYGNNRIALTPDLPIGTRHILMTQSAQCCNNAAPVSQKIRGRLVKRLRSVNSRH